MPTYTRNEPQQCVLLQICIQICIDPYASMLSPRLLVMVSLWWQKVFARSPPAAEALCGLAGDAAEGSREGEAALPAPSWSARWRQRRELLCESLDSILERLAHRWMVREREGIRGVGRGERARMQGSWGGWRDAQRGLRCT